MTTISTLTVDTPELKELKELKECDICYNIKDSIENRCRLCNISICLTCHWNDLKGLCPICDREELNIKQICCECYGEFHYKDITMHYICSKIVCYDCFENWRHDCYSENNSNNNSDNDSDSDNDTDNDSDENTDCTDNKDYTIVTEESIIENNKEFLDNIKKNLAIITIQLFWKKYK